MILDRCIVIGDFERGDCLSDRDRLDDPERDLATDPVDEDRRRWERELARADVSSWRGPT